MVCGEGPDGPVFLDDTGVAVHDVREAKQFTSQVDAEAGLRIAELAPAGAVEGWRVLPLADLS